MVVHAPQAADHPAAPAESRTPPPGRKSPRTAPPVQRTRLGRRRAPPAAARAQVHAFDVGCGEPPGAVAPVGGDDEERALRARRRRTPRAPRSAQFRPRGKGPARRVRPPVHPPGPARADKAARWTAPRAAAPGGTQPGIGAPVDRGLRHESHGACFGRCAVPHGRGACWQTGAGTPGPGSDGHPTGPRTGLPRARRPRR